MSVFDSIIKEVRAKQAKQENPVSPAPAAPAVNPAPQMRPTSVFGGNERERMPRERAPMRPMGMASYETGTDYVPETGPAILHKGEKVVPAKENQDIMTEGPGSRARTRETNAVIKAISGSDDPPAHTPYVSQKVDKVHPPKVKGEKRISPAELKEMSRPLGSFAKGTASVPKTGPYTLHAGEAVIPAKDNPMSSLFDKIPGRTSDEKPPKKLKSIHTRKAKGGYIHEHHHTDPVAHPMEEHTSADKAAMLKHMDDHMGQPDNAAEEAAESPAQEAAEQAAMK